MTYLEVFTVINGAFDGPAVECDSVSEAEEKSLAALEACETELCRDSVDVYILLHSHERELEETCDCVQWATSHKPFGSYWPSQETVSKTE